MPRKCPFCRGTYLHDHAGKIAQIYSFHSPFYCALFNVTVMILSLRLVKGLYGMQQVSPSLGLPMWSVYSAIPIGCCLMAARSLQYYIASLKQSAEGDVI